MPKGKYRIVIRQTASLFRQDETPLETWDIGRAQGIAQHMLREYRLTKPDGDRWDRWEVKSWGTPTRLPRILSYGDHLDIRHTVTDPDRDE
jgi:hypothetical protein